MLTVETFQLLAQNGSVMEVVQIAVVRSDVTVVNVTCFAMCPPTRVKALVTFQDEILIHNHHPAEKL